MCLRRVAGRQVLPNVAVYSARRSSDWRERIERAKALERYLAVIDPMLTPDAWVLFLGTRWHEDDRPHGAIAPLARVQVVEHATTSWLNAGRTAPESRCLYSASGSRQLEMNREAEGVPAGHASLGKQTLCQLSYCRSGSR